MIGLFAEHSTLYLRLSTLLTLIVFVVPITFAPLWWARRLKWAFPEDTALAVYFGRCLGGVGGAIAATALIVAGDAALEAPVYMISIMLSAAMVVVHAVGWLEKAQPWTETAEIPMWVALAVLGLLFYPG